jgi:DNA-3-methyladenine glycosylase II
MKTRIDPEAALLHFQTADPAMAAMLVAARTAPEPLLIPSPRKPDEFFTSITRSIVGQQISVKAAASVYAKLVATVGEISPENISTASDEALRAAGLSGQKAKYLKRNAAIWHEIPVHSFNDMEDEAVIDELTKLYGIGRWTAEMFLMFSLARPDVFSFGDLGLMQGLYQSYAYKPHWKRKIAATVDSWAPHRTMASLVLWHRKDNGPLLY